MEISGRFFKPTVRTRKENGKLLTLPGEMVFTHVTYCNSYLHVLLFISSSLVGFRL